MSKKSKWTESQIDEFKIYQRKGKERLRIGYSPNDAYSDAPPGFSEWFHETWDERKKQPIKRTKSVSMTAICWNCNKKYGGTKCPYCGASPRKII